MKYATLMDSVNEMSASVRLMLSDMVKNDTTMDASRYNDLSKIANDEAALAEAKATPSEIEDQRRLPGAREGLCYGACFQQGEKTLAADPLLKERYDSLMLELGKDDPTIQQ